MNKSNKRKIFFLIFTLNILFIYLIFQAVSFIVLKIFATQNQINYPEGGGLAFVQHMSFVLFFSLILVPPLSHILSRSTYYFIKIYFKLQSISNKEHILIGALAPTFAYLSLSIFFGIFDIWQIFFSLILFVIFCVWNFFVNLILALIIRLKK